VNPPNIVHSLSDLQGALGQDGCALVTVNIGDAVAQVQELSNKLGAPVGHKHANASTQIVDIRAGGIYDSARRPQSTPERQSAHTDGAFLESPPSIVSLCGISTAEHGGESILVHGRDLLVEALALMSAEDLSVLFEPDCYRVHRGTRSFSRPVLSPSCDGTRIHIAFGTHEFNRVEVKPSARLPFELLRGLRCRHDLQQRFLLAPGTAIFVSNLTVLHGRETWFDSQSRRRHVIRVWIAAYSDSLPARLAGVDVTNGPEELRLLMAHGLRRLQSWKEAV
jgi:alpha-ketoglutarate-dependent taurine dioxygenase